MSHFAVHISTDGAAFRDADEAELPLASPEVARILRDLADRIEADESTDLFRLRDINGNRVGFATFHASDEELAV